MIQFPQEPENLTGIVNPEELNEIMDNDMDLIRECFEDFIRDWPKISVQIQGAVFEKNAQDLQNFSHNLKGMLIYLAAEPAAKAAYALESAGAEDRMGNIEKQWETLENESQRLTDYIHHFLKQSI